MATRVSSREYREWQKSWDSDDPLILLVTLTHPSLSEPVRVSSDPTKFLQLDPETQEPIYGTISNGETFYAYPFEFVLPDQPEGSDSSVKASFRVDNVTRQYTAIIRDLQSAPALELYFCFASDPDTIVETLPPLLVTDISYDVKTIHCDLSAKDFRMEPFPAVQFYPSRFPGLFA